MNLSGKVLRKYNEALAETDYEFIADQMHNDEFSSDEEMIQFLSDELGADKSKIKKLVEKERNNFLGSAYLKNTMSDDIKIIKKYL
jgi:hypothetical protein